MSSTEPQPVHEYDVVANGYETVLNLTEEAAKAYPGAKRRSGSLAADHPDRVRAQQEAAAGSKARTAPNK
mgnify:FL=1